MLDSFTLDWRTALLGLCVLQMTVIAMALLRRPGRSAADRWFAGFLFVLSGVLTPYVIGYAGAFHRWPWLTFLPVALPLALGPALYGYVHARATGRPPARAHLHLAPPLLQVAYFASAFLLPLELKWAWFTGPHTGTVAPALDLAALASLAGYSAAIARVVLAQPDMGAADAAWFRRVLAALGSVLLVKMAFDLWSVLVAPAGYDAQTWLYLAFAGAGLFLAIEGWRRTAEPAGAACPPRRTRTCAPSPTILGAAYAERIRREGWWSEPELNVATLARRLGVSEGRLSRAFNQGLGVGLSRHLNDLRSDAVAEALRRGAQDDLLSLAFENGFASKASFNRAFQARFGRSPSDFRREVSDSVKTPDAPEMQRA